MDKLIELLDELLHINRYLKFQISQQQRNSRVASAYLIILERKLKHNTECINTIKNKIDGIVESKAN